MYMERRRQAHGSAITQQGDEEDADYITDYRHHLSAVYSKPGTELNTLHVLQHIPPQQVSAQDLCSCLNLQVIKLRCRGPKIHFVYGIVLVYFLVRI